MASKLFYVAFSQMFLQGAQHFRNVGQLFYHIACKLQQTGCACQKHPALWEDVEKGLSMLGCLIETLRRRWEEAFTKKVSRTPTESPWTQDPTNSYDWGGSLIPVLKCHCLEVRTCGLHRRTGWEKHQCTEAYSHEEDAKKSMSFSVIHIEATECSFLIFGSQSQKTDVTLCYFLSLASSPLARLKQLLASLEQLGSRAASFTYTIPFWITFEPKILLLCNLCFGSLLFHSPCSNMVFPNPHRV